MLYLHNVTGRKQAEEELQRINFELDSFVCKASHNMRGLIDIALGQMDEMARQESDGTQPVHCQAQVGDPDEVILKITLDEAMDLVVNATSPVWTFNPKMGAARTKPEEDNYNCVV